MTKVINKQDKKKLFGLFRLAQIFLALIFVCVPSLAQLAEVDDKIKRAIELVREGQLNEGYIQLQLLHEAYPDNQTVLYDLVEIAARAGDSRKSLEYGHQIKSLVDAPGYTLEYLAKVSRAEGDYAMSYKYYRLLSQKQPKADYLLGQMMAH